MYQLDDYNGINFFTKEELNLVDTNTLKQVGYLVRRVISSYGHETIYYYNPDKPYVYAQCYFANINAYTQIIISRDYIDELKVLEDYINPILIKSYKCKQAVLCVRKQEHILNTFLPKYTKSYISAYTCSNVIDSKTTYSFTDEMCKEGIIFPKSVKRSVGVSYKGSFELEIIDKRNINTVPKLRREGFRVAIFEGEYFRITKRFDTELEAWKAYGEYEKEFYKYLRFNPFTDYMSQNFDIAFKALILEELSIDDVIKVCLNEWKDDWEKIMRLNLQHLYEEYNIPYIGVLSDTEGFARPNKSVAES